MIGAMPGGCNRGRGGGATTRPGRCNQSGRAAFARMTDCTASPCTAALAPPARRRMAPATVTALATLALTAAAFGMGLATEGALHGAPAPVALAITD